MIYENPLPLIAGSTDHLSYAIFSIFSIALSLAILIAVYIEQKASSPNNWYHIANDEYDFMASGESEQSRLDLAEAYIDIGHYQDANPILNELLNSNNPITKEKAKQLLSRT